MQLAVSTSGWLQRRATRLQNPDDDNCGVDELDIVEETFIGSHLPRAQEYTRGDTPAGVHDD